MIHKDFRHPYLTVLQNPSREEKKLCNRGTTQEFSSSYVFAQCQCKLFSFDEVYEIYFQEIAFKEIPNVKKSTKFPSPFHHQQSVYTLFCLLSLLREILLHKI